MADGDKLVKLRIIIENAEKNANTNKELLERLDYLFDTFNALLDFV